MVKLPPKSPDGGLLNSPKARRRGVGGLDSVKKYFNKVKYIIYQGFFINSKIANLEL